VPFNITGINIKIHHLVLALKVFFEVFREDFLLVDNAVAVVAFAALLVFVLPGKPDIDRDAPDDLGFRRFADVRHGLPFDSCHSGHTPFKATISYYFLRRKCANLTSGQRGQVGLHGLREGFPIGAKTHVHRDIAAAERVGVFDLSQILFGADGSGGIHVKFYCCDVYPLFARRDYVLQLAQLRNGHRRVSFHDFLTSILCPAGLG